MSRFRRRYFSNPENNYRVLSKKYHLAFSYRTSAPYLPQKYICEHTYVGVGFGGMGGSYGWG